MAITVEQLKRILGSFGKSVGSDMKQIKAAKQDKLVAGENIKIAEDGTISATVATTNVDLSAYSTTAQVETLVDNKVTSLATKQEVEEKVNAIQVPSIEGLVKETDVETKLADYAKTSEVAATYATKETVNAINGLDANTIATLKNLSEHSDLTAIANKVDNVYTKAETDDKLATKADVTAIPSVEGLAKVTDVESTYAKKTELPDVSGLATKAEVAAITVPSIEGLAKTTEVEAKLVDYAKKTELPSIEGLAKVTDVDTKLATKADVSAIPDVSGLATKAEVTTVNDRVTTLEGKHYLTSEDEENIKTTLKAELVTEETLTQNINQLSTVVDGKIETAKGEVKAKVTEVEGKLADYAKKTELPSIEGLAKASEIETTYAKKTELPDVSSLAKTTEVVAKSVYDEKVQSLESEISTLKTKLAEKATIQSGTTEQRPTENLVVGQTFFDTTLGVPVFWNGTEWHNPFANITTVEVEHH